MADDLHYLTAGEARRLFLMRELSPVELMAGDDRPYRGGRPGGQRRAHPLLRRRPAGSPAGRGALRRQARRTAPARGYPGRRQGRGRGGRPTLHRRLARLQGRDRRGHGRQRAAGDRRRRHHPRAHHDPRVLLRGDHRVATVGRDAQPLEPRLQPRRLVGRLGRRAGGRHGDPRHRLRHRRLDPYSGLVLRRGGLQAALRPRAAATALQPRPLLPRGAAGALGRRLPRCSRTSWPGRTPKTSPRCGPSSPSRRSCRRWPA